MWKYLAKRLLLFIPSLMLLVILCFCLLRIAPGDPMAYLLRNADNEFSSEQIDPILLRHLNEQTGLNLPVFYFSIQPLSSLGWKRFIPWIEFHSDNQWKRWIFGNKNFGGLIRGDFGNSLITNEKVSTLISSRIIWSMVPSLLSLILAYLISVPAGIKMATQPNSFTSRKASVTFNILFSLPTFWIALLLLMCFANPYMLNWLPSSGIAPTNGFSSEMNSLTKAINTIPYLILPVFCYTYGAFAFLSSTLSQTLESILTTDFIRTARAKGLPEKQVIQKHAYRNALLPMITLFSQAFPAIIGGSVIIETIFSIPGMGLTIYQAIASKDYPVIIAVFFIIGFITMTGFLIADVLYAYADPRIRYSREVVK